MSENIVGKGENAGYQHSLLFPQSFYKPSVSGSLTLSQTTNFRLVQIERVLQTTISNLMNMAESSPKG